MHATENAAANRSNRRCERLRRDAADTVGVAMIKGYEPRSGFVINEKARRMPDD
jgi:hypothetical protein